ncbi:hypothetical protein [Candidatus Paracaedibacter symbiosus]|uniref:hypothetical protein n=1 Tax=Candidatus Paracaedibacter symbiosus TaxID=244582 RepID=UPI0006917EB8|nr:hypothetical protein [Candidatus Paracaedibacter symbiosus]
MLKYTKILFQSAAVLAFAVATLTPDTSFARSSGGGNNNQSNYSNQGNGGGYDNGNSDDQGNGGGYDNGNSGDQGNGGGYDNGNSDNQGNGGGYDNGNFGNQGNGGGYDNGGQDGQGSSNPSLNVQVNRVMKGEFGNMFGKEQEKFEIFLRAMDNSTDSTKGSKPVRLPIDGGQATFDIQDGDQPKALLVGLSKKGNSYQQFCQGPKLKDGVMKGFPPQITITLKNGNPPYKAANGMLRNDAYPVCMVE